jgi:hypothetical protein
LERTAHLQNEKGLHGQRPPLAGSSNRRDVGGAMTNKDLYNLLVSQKADTDARFDGIQAQLVGHDQKFDGIDARFDLVDKKFADLQTQFVLQDVKLDELYEVIISVKDAAEASFDQVGARLNDVVARLERRDKQVSRLETRVEAIEAKVVTLGDDGHDSEE